MLPSGEKIATRYKVILTKNDVDHAIQYPKNTILILVHSVDVTAKSKGNISVSRGEVETSGRVVARSHPPPIPRRNRNKVGQKWGVIMK